MGIDSEWSIPMIITGFETVLTVRFTRGESNRKEIRKVERKRKQNNPPISHLFRSFEDLKYSNNAYPAPRNRHRKINQTGVSVISTNVFGYQVAIPPQTWITCPLT
jgi:hypothetical protein